MKLFNKNIILENIKIVLLAFILSIGIGMAHAAWTSPTVGPTACPDGSPGCAAPIHTGVDGQIKQGGLTVGQGLAAGQLSLSVLHGNAGIGTSEPSQMLDVVGYSKSRTGFCINDDCITAWGGGEASEFQSNQIVAAFNLSSCPSGWSPFTDAAGRVILGVGESNATGHTPHTLGQKSGAETHQQTAAEVASHSHSLSISNPVINYLGSQSKKFCINNNCGNSSGTITTGEFINITVQSTGNGTPMNIMNPYVGLTYCSKNIP